VARPARHGALKARMKARCLLLVLLGLLAAPANAAPNRDIVVLRIDGAIQPASLRYLERGLRLADERAAALVVVELDTPGGTLVSLRSMTTAIMQSRVPVAVYVTPSGAHAASAGFFLLIAADVAAMTPGTNTGAAHPVALGTKDKEKEEADNPDPGIAKATEDAAALARSLAAARGRSVSWAEKAVRESRAYSAEEAERYDLVDVIANDRDDLLTQIDGRGVRGFDGEPRTIRVHGGAVVTVGQTLAERVLMVIGDPQVAYLLFMLGILGLMVELLSPGAVVPGIAGVVALLLALYAFSVLPVNWAGTLLIAVGIGLLVAEAFVTSYGLLTVGGLVSFVLGSWMLIDTPIPELRISLAMIVPAAIVLAAASIFLASRAWRARGAKPQSGVEAMVGELGELTNAIEASHGEGKVFVHGEYWTATAEEPLPSGVKVRVERVEGHRLHVAPADLVTT
jgi:membrane-bound serine protease (ClpP class)